MIESITRKSTAKEIDEFLRDKRQCDFGFWEFAYSLQVVTLIYLTDEDRKKRKSHILNELDMWKVVKERKKRIDEEDDLIVEKFNLSFICDLIEKRIQLLTNRLEMIDKLTYKIRTETLRMDPCSLLILIWSIAMKVEKKSSYEDFDTIASLMDWFAIRGWEKFFKRIPTLNKDAIKTTYLRYMKPTNPKREIYKKMATVLYVECFLEANPLKKIIFPDPFDWGIWELTKIYPLTAEMQKK